jgi:hypothetical protein
MRLLTAIISLALMAVTLAAPPPMASSGLDEHGKLRSTNQSSITAFNNQAQSTTVLSSSHIDNTTQHELSADNLSPDNKSTTNPADTTSPFTNLTSTRLGGSAAERNAQDQGPRCDGVKYYQPHITISCRAYQERWHRDVFRMSMDVNITAMGTIFSSDGLQAWAPELYASYKADAEAVSNTFSENSIAVGRLGQNNYGFGLRLFCLHHTNYEQIRGDLAAALRGFVERTVCAEDAGSVTWQQGDGCELVEGVAPWGVGVRPEGEVKFDW